jgi:hypothetical protein
MMELKTTKQDHPDTNATHSARLSTFLTRDSPMEVTEKCQDDYSFFQFSKLYLVYILIFIFHKISFLLVEIFLS